jgi:Protein of unknown function (DUF1552)
MKSFRLNRRAVLRGAGVSMALPLLEAMMPVGKTAFADSAKPPRFIGYFTCYGMLKNYFQMPTGAIAQLSPTLSPFESLKDKITQVKGLDNPGGNRFNGDLARGTQSFLRAGSYGPSVDQIAHKAHMASNERTRFGSLALGVNGSCLATDQGGGPTALCAISWSSTDVMVPKDFNPQALFNKLFMSGDAQTKSQQAIEGSVLSAVKDDAKKMQQRLGASDQQIVQQYFNNIEEIEKRISQFPVGPAGSCSQETPPPDDAVTKPQRAKALSDLAVLALKCDQARYLSFMLENGAEASVYTFLGNVDSRERLAMTGDSPALRAVEHWLMEMLAYLIQGLKDAKDLTGASLLDSCVVALGNNLSEGSRYTHTDMPFLLAGSCNGYFKMGQTIDATGHNYGDVWVTVLDALGFPQDRVGDSHGMLNAIKS